MTNAITKYVDIVDEELLLNQAGKKLKIYNKANVATKHEIANQSIVSNVQKDLIIETLDSALTETIQELETEKKKINRYEKILANDSIVNKSTLEEFNKTSPSDVTVKDDDIVDIKMKLIKDNYKKLKSLKIQQ